MSQQQTVRLQRGPTQFWIIQQYAPRGDGIQPEQQMTFHCIPSVCYGCRSFKVARVHQPNIEPPVCKRGLDWPTNGLCDSWVPAER